MIRINLLGGERQVKKKAMTFDVGQRLTVACGLIVVLTAAGVGYWYYALQQQSTQLDADIARAQPEQVRLQSIMREGAAFDAQRAPQQQDAPADPRQRDEGDAKAASSPPDTQQWL